MDAQTGSIESGFQPQSTNFLRQSVRARFRFGAVLMAAAALAVALGSMTVIWLFDSSHRETEITAIALRNHVEGDMMHDAIRSSVLEVQLAAGAGDAKATLQAGEDLERYAVWFEGLIKENKELALPPQTKELLTRVDGPLKNYLGDARAVQAAFASGASNTARLTQGFDEDFESLEKAMLAVSNDLEAELLASRKRNDQLTLFAWAGVGGLTLLLLLIIGWSYRAILRDVIAPLEQQTSSLFALSRGESDVEVTGEDRNDELGRLAQGIIAFRTTARDVIDAREARIRADDLADKAADTAKSEAAKREQMQALAVSMEQRVLGVVDQLAGQVREQLTLAESIAVSADRTRVELMVASGTGTQIVESMNQVAAATQQLAISSTNIGSVVHDTIERTLAAADRSAEATGRADALMDSIHQIKGFAQLIADIARQTNQLALNARIEASRAGEAGNSFAVVATEIKDLAEHAAGATSTITERLSSIKEIAEAVMASIGEVNKSVDALRETSSVVAESIEEQNLATSSIGTSIQEVATGTRDLGNMVHSVEVLTTNGIADSDKLKSQAALLDQLARGLRDDVAKVIGEVRSA